MRTAEAFATVFEQHRRVLRRQAGRLLRGTRPRPRRRAAGRLSCAPTPPWRPASCRSSRAPGCCGSCATRASTSCAARARGRSATSCSRPCRRRRAAAGRLVARAEARALLGDIHRFPDRQKSVLVMSALDGLSHEEVADRLDTTVNTTRSLLARARENLRRTAVAREAACASVMDAIEEAALAGVRASELARRHLWSCADCRAFQRDLRVHPVPPAPARVLEPVGARRPAPRRRRQGRGRRVLRARRRRRSGDRAGRRARPPRPAGYARDSAPLIPRSRAPRRAPHRHSAGKPADPSRNAVATPARRGAGQVHREGGRPLSARKARRRAPVIRVNRLEHRQFVDGRARPPAQAGPPKST